MHFPCTIRVHARVPLASLLAGLAVAGFLGLHAGTARAARPMVTDDARVVDPKACQVETWVRRNQGSTEFWAIPACNFTGNLELSMGGARTRPDGGGAGTTDQLVQGKTVFRPMASNGWGWGLVLGTYGHPGVGREWYGYLPASVSFADDAVVLHTNLGWQRDPETRRDNATWGLGSETRLGGGSWLVAETFGQQHGKAIFQVGVRHWIVPDHVQVDITYGNRWSGGTDARWISVGLRLLSAAFLP